MHQRHLRRRAERRLEYGKKAIDLKIIAAINAILDDLTRMVETHSKEAAKEIGNLRTLGDIKAPKGVKNGSGSDVQLSSMSASN